MYVYILINQKNGTLYVGVTGDLVKRIFQHKNKIFKGFTCKYGVDKLVYYEVCSDGLGAIQREKQLKCWRRDWKINLIEEQNPHWEDLYNKLLG